MSEGLYKKYNVTKANGTPNDPRAKYFVLRIDNDLDALIAALRWARAKGNDKLFNDLTHHLVFKRVEAPDIHD